MSQLNSNQNETLDYSSAPPAVFNFDKKLMMVGLFSSSVFS
jgi:hypothetical protein